MKLYKVGDLIRNDQPNSRTYTDIGEIVQIDNDHVTYFWYRNHYQFVMSKRVFDESIINGSYRIIECDDKEKLALRLKYV